MRLRTKIYSLFLTQREETSQLTRQIHMKQRVKQETLTMRRTVSEKEELLKED